MSDMAEEIQKALGVSEQLDEEGRVAWLEVRGNCRQWLRWQQGEIDRLTKELADAKENCSAFESLWTEAKSQLAEKDKVLEWYADEDTHEIKRRMLGDFAPISLDKGKRARDILTKYKQG